MIKLTDTSIVYLVCPSARASGGPELMHQLAHHLAQKGVDARMYYVPQTKNPVHPNFVKYGTKYATEIDDNENNLIIFPEGLVTVYFELRHIRKCIWWLSVDNFYPTFLKSQFTFLPYNIIFRLLKFGAVQKYCLNKALKQRFAYHLVQSLYAKDHLSKAGIDSLYLSDYINNVFITDAELVDVSNKENIVAYNPLKGYAFTKEIITRSPQLRWVAIQNMTPEQVKDLLARAKVYIDFGDHPGKDRIPREAALMQCCVITGQKGSAAFEDVNISPAYKFQDKVENIPAIISTIESMMRDYDSHISQYAAYRKEILESEDKFSKDIDQVFGLIAI